LFQLISSYQVVLWCVLFIFVLINRIKTNFYIALAVKTASEVI